jgi:hypothetical protein
MRVVPGIVFGILLTCPRLSTAQPSEPAPSVPPRTFVDLNLIGTMSSTSKSRNFTGRFVTFGEAGSSRVTYPKPSRASQLPSIDVGAGYMTGSLIGLAVNYSRLSFDDVAQLSTTVPHPLILNAPGSGASVTNRTLSRDETMLSLNAVAVPLRNERAEARIVGGFSYFWLNAEMVSNVSYSQTSSVAPFTNTVTVTGFTDEQGKGHGLGFNVGGDYTHFFTRRAGVRAGLRYSDANVRMASEPLSRLGQRVKVGGLMFFLGARFRFGN